MGSEIVNINWKLQVARKELTILKDKHVELNIPMASLTPEQYQEFLFVRGRLKEEERWVQTLEQQLVEAERWEATPTSEKLRGILLPIIVSLFLITGFVAGLWWLANQPWGAMLAFGAAAFLSVVIVSFKQEVRKWLGTD